MAKTVSQTNWETIQSGVRETERLLGRKEYNLSMIKARQTLETMVKALAEAKGLEEQDLIDMIDALYQSKVISKSTADHYHKIRMIGNKAAHDNDDNAYSANTAHHLLSQEVVIFSNDYFVRKQISRSSKNRRVIKKKTSSAKGVQDMKNILKFLLPILIILLLIPLIRRCSLFSGSGNTETLPTTITETASSESIEETSTVAETETVSLVYTTTAALNVRSAPSTDGDKLATLAAGTVVDYVGAYNSQWAIINYNGAQAYVASAYLTAQ